ncbi:MAG: DUF4157 domain-containing protein [Mesorhizobium sp.]|nr:MAG: DUF4157 domain-containing protein [Mesorhizobium sp.]
MSKISSLLAVIFFLVAAPSQGLACPSDQYEECFLGACACFPKIGGDVGREAERLKKEFQGQVGGHALIPYIQQSRNDAMRGAQSIPPHIRQALTGYASEDSMNRVRYKIGDNGIVNLAHLTMQLGWDNPRAITLIDVVVFKGPSEAQDIALWAHELVHVDQYRDWGLRDFAIRYARDHDGVEAPGYAKERGYAQWAQSNGGIGPGPVIQPQFGAFCHTPIGRFGPGPVQPMGAFCFVNTMNGPVNGQVGP